MNINKKSIKIKRFEFIHNDIVLHNFFNLFATRQRRIV